MYVPKIIRLMDFMKEITVQMRNIRNDRVSRLDEMQRFFRYGIPSTDRSSLVKLSVLLLSGWRDVLWFRFLDSYNILVPRRYVPQSAVNRELRFGYNPIPRDRTQTDALLCSQKLSVANFGAVRSVDLFLV